MSGLIKEIAIQRHPMEKVSIRNSGRFMTYDGSYCTTV